MDQDKRHRQLDGEKPPRRPVQRRASDPPLSAAQQEKDRRSSMDPVRDVTPLEEYQLNYLPVVTDRLLGQRVVKQHGVDSRRLNLTLDKLAQQRSVCGKQAEKERRAVQRELDALQNETVGAHDGGLVRNERKSAAVFVESEEKSIRGVERRTGARTVAGYGPERTSSRISSNIEYGIKNTRKESMAHVQRSKSVK